MPIIAHVGRRTLSTRLLLATMYAALTVGGLSMLYPFLLMIATATTSEPDVREFRVIPRFWYDRTALYQRYLHEKYQAIADFNQTNATDIHAWSQVVVPSVARNDEVASAQRVESWRRFVTSLPCDFIAGCHVGGRSLDMLVYSSG